MRRDKMAWVKPVTGKPLTLYFPYLWLTILFIFLCGFPKRESREPSTIDRETLEEVSRKNESRCCKHCQCCVPLLVYKTWDVNITSIYMSLSRIVQNAIQTLNESSRRKYLQQTFEFISAASCIGICTYVFVEAYNNIENNVKKISILWYVAPLGFHAIFMFVSSVSNIYFAKIGMLVAIWFIGTFMVTTAYIILLLRLPSRRHSSYNTEDPKSHVEGKNYLSTLKNSSKEMIQEEILHFDMIQEKKIEKEAQDQPTSAVLAPIATTQEDSTNKYYQHLHKILKDAQILYDSDSPCEPPYLKMWCRTFANSLNEDLEVRCDSTLFKTARKFKIDLYSDEGTNFEERCKEYHKKLRVVTFKLAYEAMEGWQKHGQDFPLEESRSLILSIASKWMTVVQEWIAKEETNLKPEEMGPDDEQKVWFRKAVERQRELNLEGIKDGSGSKLLVDKWILMGLTFGSLGGNIMMQLVEKND